MVDDAAQSTTNVKSNGSANYYDLTMRSPIAIAQNVLKNSAVTCSITMPVQEFNTTDNYTHAVTTTFPFYMSDDFGFSMSSSYEPLIDNNSAFGTINNMLSKFNAFQEDTQVALQSQPMSTLMWKGSEFSGFSINCVFVCTTRRINPAAIIRTLGGCVLPTKLRDNDNSLGAGAAALGLAKATTAAVSDFGHELVGGLFGWASDSLTKFANNSKVQAISDATTSATSTAAENTDKFLTEQMKKDPNLDRMYQNMKADAAKNGEVISQDWKSFSDRLKQSNKEKVHKIIMDAGMVAPLHYGVTFVNSDTDGGKISVQAKPYTTVTLRIGDWFEANNLVVSDISNVKFSKELVAPRKSPSSMPNDIYKEPDEADGSRTENWGFPLYATCTLTLKPICMVDYDTFKGYFKSPVVPDIKLDNGGLSIS